MSGDGVVDGCRTTTDSAADDDEASNDVMDAAVEFDIVGRYARYDEVRSADCDLGRAYWLLHLTIIRPSHRRGNRGSGGSKCSPTKLLGEQLIRPAQHFFCTF